MNMMPTISCCLLALLVIASGASAQCMRLVPKDPKSPAEMDGPGAFGPLHDTLTLDCLRFAGAIQHGKEWTAILTDEKGRSYRVVPGDRVGEHDGRIFEVTAEQVTIVQLVQGRAGNWIERKIYLLRGRQGGRL